MGAERTEDEGRMPKWVPVVMCGRAYPRNVPQDIEACPLCVAVGDAAFFMDPGRMNEVAVAVYYGTNMATTPLTLVGNSADSRRLTVSALVKIFVTYLAR